MTYKFWAPCISFIHLCLLKQGWVETNSFWDRRKGVLWVKLEKTDGY